MVRNLLPLVPLLRLLQAGCSGKPVQSIRIGANIWRGYECLFLAIEKGFYDVEDVNVQPISAVWEAP